jgi:nucleoside-diphosphate-sugar epimerase
MLVVTGISGHSGYYFLEELESKGYQGKIRGLIRSTSNIDHLRKFHLDIEFRISDLEDIEDMKQAFEGAHTVLHIAGIRLSPIVVEAAMAQQVDWVILVHTTGRYSKFKSAAEGYIQIEDAILSLKSRQNITILRPTMIYGSSFDKNISRLIAYIDTHRFFPIFGSGKNLMQPVTGRDLAIAYTQILNNPATTKGQEYDLSGGQPIRYIDMLKLVAKNLNKRTIFIPIPMRLSILLAKVYNRILSRALISVEQVQRMQEDKVFPHLAATRDFGYAPMTFEEGIKVQCMEYKNRRK